MGPDVPTRLAVPRQEAYAFLRISQSDDHVGGIANGIEVFSLSGRVADVVVSKNTHELKTRARRDVSDRRVNAWFANGS